jgi:hypothetical protein
MTQAALPGFSLTVPLIKIDIERRLVVGRAAREEQDKSKEIMDYASAKPMFQKWSDGYAMNQIPGAEMSKGNLRVMHSRNVAGKLTELGFNDDEKSIDIICKVSDDNEWKKVMDGCYTGFSIGGGYANKWKDGDLTRYTPDVREISLVDNPCMPSARIVELVKADGMVGELELRGKPPSGFAAAWAARPKSFAENWAARPVAPRTFGQMMKAFDGSKHPREHDGQFAGKTAERVGRFAGGAAAAGGGYYLGSKHGSGVGEAIGRAGANLYSRVADAISPKSGLGHLAAEQTEMRAGSIGRMLGAAHGAKVGAVALGLGGYLAGSALGAQADRMARKRRAVKAGRLDVYERLNATVSVKPNSKKQVKAAVQSAGQAHRRIQRVVDTVSTVLGKAFDETKHGRDTDGKFKGNGSYKGDEQADATTQGALGGAGTGFAAGVGAAAALDAGPRHIDRMADSLRYGSARNKAAAGLRADPVKRQGIVSGARTARVAASDAATDPRTKELADAIHRKVMEEAANDGRDPGLASIDADKAAAQVRGSRPKGGAGLRRGQKAAAGEIKARVGDYLKRMKAGRGWMGSHMPAMSTKLGLGLAGGGAAAGLIGGAYAGYKSADETQRIAGGKKPAASRTVTAGDGLRSLSVGLGVANLGGLAGSVVAEALPRGKARLAAQGIGALAGLVGGTAYGAHMINAERADAASFASRKKDA